MNSETPTPLAQLIAAHLDEGLDAEQRKHLNQLLNSSNEARAEFIAALRQDILLGEVLRERDEHVPLPTREANTKLSVAQSRRPWLWMAAAAAALLALILLFPKGPQQSNIQVTEIALIESIGQDAKLIRATSSVSLSNGSKLLSNDRLETGRDTQITVKYSDGTQITLLEHTIAIFSSYGTAPGGKKVNLVSGTVTANVMPQIPASPMILATPDAEATVVGTKFSLSAGGGQSTLEVQNGIVRFASAVALDQKAVEVTAGFRAVVSDLTHIEVRPIAAKTSAAAQSATATGPEVLLVTAARIPFYEHDAAIKAILEGMNFKVIEKLYSEVTSEDAKGKALLVIPSHMCNGTRVFSKSPVPAMCWHAVWYEDLGMIDAAHSRSEALKPQWVHVTEQLSAASFHVPNQQGLRLGLYASAIPGGGAKVFAALNDQSKRAVFFGYESGEAMHGFTAPARRAGFSIDVRDYDGQDTPVDAGKQLLMAAIKWCLGKEAAKAGD